MKKHFHFFIPIPFFVQFIFCYSFIYSNIVILFFFSFKNETKILRTVNCQCIRIWDKHEWSISHLNSLSVHCNIPAVYSKPMCVYIIITMLFYFTILYEIMEYIVFQFLVQFSTKVQEEFYKMYI